MQSTMMFVCTGNICRSPYAERHARRLAEQLGATGWDFVSAGTSAVVGAPMDAAMSHELVQHGGNPEQFRARQLTTDLLQASTLVVTMERYHRTYVLDDHPALARRTLTLRQLQRAVDAQPPSIRGADLLAAVTGTVIATRRGDSIADPYRRGAEAMATAAADIRAALSDTVTRLLG